MLTCEVCGTKFDRPGTRGPVPRRCSQKCVTKAGRTDGRREYERNYRAAVRRSGRLAEYEYGYNRRPEVRARNAERMRIKWHTDPEYRARQLARWGDEFAGVMIPAPYTGHIWLDIARQAAGVNHLDGSAPWADDYYDDMGEALLALLEGRDPREAVSEYRRREYVPRRLTLHLGDWGDDEEEQNRWFEKVMPSVPSAEDVFLSSYP